MRSRAAEPDDLTEPADGPGTVPTSVTSTGNVRVAVHDLGGRGRPLLLAHATGFHGRVWQPCARHLTDFHCIAPDLRGHGDAKMPDDLTYEWSGFADDILAVVDALADAGLIDVRTGLVAAGHSKGGAALLLAEQRRPGTFRALYLFEPIVMPAFRATPGPASAGGTGAAASPENPMAAAARKRRDSFPSFDAAYENFRSKAPLDALHPDALRAYVEHGFRPDDDVVAIKCRPEVEAQVYEMGGRHSAYDHLAEVTCPVTVAHGVELPFSPATFAAPIVAALPHGRLEPHEDLGHFGPLEDPATIAACIRTALSGA